MSAETWIYSLFQVKMWVWCTGRWVVRSLWCSASVYYYRQTHFLVNLEDFTGHHMHVNTNPPHLCSKNWLSSNSSSVSFHTPMSQYLTNQIQVLVLIVPRCCERNTTQRDWSGQATLSALNRTHQWRQISAYYLNYDPSLAVPWIRNNDISPGAQIRKVMTSTKNWTSEATGRT